MRRLRRLAAWCALLAICFVQLATAAHACMLMTAPQPDTPCAEMGMASGDERPALCVEHCKGDVQLVDHHSPVPVAAAPAVTPIVVAAAADVLATALPGRFAPDPEPPLPVFAASSRLRI